MGSIPETPAVVRDIVDNADERELWIVGREFERPPYFHAGKGGDTRLARALRVCIDNRIMPQSDGTYMVEGSEHRTYRVGDSCSCPNSQKANSKWCYHAVAVALYIEWQRRLRPPVPVALGTLRAGTLPLPPTTVDERLAQPAADLPLIAPREEGPVYTTSDGTRYTLESRPFLQPSTPEGEGRPDDHRVALGTMRDATALQAHHTPQEDRMADDEYLTEPDDQNAPVTVLEPQAPSTSVPRPLPGPVLLPALDARNLEQSMQAWSDQRKVVRRFLQQELVEGTDYYTLRIKGRETKPALSKAGSEKFMALFQLHATFEQDAATWTMLGQPQGTLCYVCRLHTRSGELIGEGRGARTLQQDGGDINKAVKMACKSSMVDAILRTGALSDVFTQDEESIPSATVEPAKATPPTKPTGSEYRQRIWAMMQAQAPDVRTREQAEAWIQQETGYALHPDRYPDIIASLETRA